MLQDEVDLQRTSLTPLEERDFADHFVASSAQPASITAWAQLQQNSRRILSLDICRAWSEAFDKAYLGEVEEGKRIAAGFGGIVRLGHLKHHQVGPVATKELPHVVCQGGSQEGLCCEPVGGRSALDSLRPGTLLLYQWDYLRSPVKNMSCYFKVSGSLAH